MVWKGLRKGFLGLEPPKGADTGHKIKIPCFFVNRL